MTDSSSTTFQSSQQSCHQPYSEERSRGRLGGQAGKAVRVGKSLSRTRSNWNGGRCALDADPPPIALAVTLPRPWATQGGAATVRPMLCRFGTAKARTEPAARVGGLGLSTPSNCRGGGAMENTGPMHSLPVRRAPNGHLLPGSVLNLKTQVRDPESPRCH
jgi:hypothetical protein